MPSTRMTASTSAKANVSPAGANGTSIAAALVAATTCEGTAFIGLTPQQRCEIIGLRAFARPLATSPRQGSRSHIEISERNSIFRGMQVKAGRGRDWAVGDVNVV